MGDADERGCLVWIDAHPDMWDRAYQPHANAMAAAALAGIDTAGLSSHLPATVDLDNVVWVGTRAELLPVTLAHDHIWRNRVIAAVADTDPVAVARRLHRKRVSRIAVHIDLDVLDSTEFSGVAVPEEGECLPWTSLTRLVKAIADEFDVVHITVAECVVDANSTLGTNVETTLAKLIRELHDLLARPPRTSAE